MIGVRWWVHLVAALEGVIDRLSVDPPLHPEIRSGTEGHDRFFIELELGEDIGLPADACREIAEGVEKHGGVGLAKLVQVEAVPVELDVLAAQGLAVDRQGLRQGPEPGDNIRDIPVGDDLHRRDFALALQRAEDPPGGWKPDVRGRSICRRQSNLLTIRIDKVPLFISDLRQHVICPPFKLNSAMSGVWSELSKANGEPSRSQESRQPSSLWLTKI